MNNMDMSKKVNNKVLTMVIKCNLRPNCDFDGNVDERMNVVEIVNNIDADFNDFLIFAKEAFEVRKIKNHDTNVHRSMGTISSSTRVKDYFTLRRIFIHTNLS